MTKRIQYSDGKTFIRTRDETQHYIIFSLTRTGLLLQLNSENMRPGCRVRYSSPSNQITCPAEHAKCRGVIPLTFLVRRSTPDSTNASANDHASTPGVLSPVDTPNSVRHTPSRGVDVLRWCLPQLLVLGGVGDAGADAGGGLTKVEDKKVLLVLLVLLVVHDVLAPRELPRQDAANPSMKCIGARAPGVQISTSTSPAPHDDGDDDDVDVSRKEVEGLQLVVVFPLGCRFPGGNISLLKNCVEFVERNTETDSEPGGGGGTQEVDTVVGEI